MIPATIAATLVGIWVVGHVRSWSLDRKMTRQFPRDADGVIVGASSIALEGTNGRAALLVHGCGDTPQSLANIAADLHRRGYSVKAPLLPGHGRSLSALATHTSDDWYRAVRESYRDLRNAHEWVGVVGLSMGAALSARLAAEVPDIPALVLLSPYLAMPKGSDLIARLSGVWGAFIPAVRTASSKSILDPAARAKGLAYGALSARTLRELRRVAAIGRHSIPRIASPTLIVQSRNDNRVSSAETQLAFDALRVDDKSIVWVDDGGHVITVDRGWERVAIRIAEWLDDHTKSHGDAPVPETSRH